MLSNKEGFIEVPGGKVWYKSIGSDGKGIPLLIVHGGPGVPHDYLEPLSTLSDERPVIFYDQLGCGNSDRPSDKSLWTLEHFVEELEIVCRELKLEKVHILGQSWGAMLSAAFYILKQPQYVVSLIFSGGLLNSLRWAEDQRKLLKGLPAEVQKVVSECELKHNYDNPEYQEAIGTYYAKYLCRLEPLPDCFNRALEKMNPEIYNTMWGPSEFTVEGNLKEVDLSADLHKIRIPVLFTCGEFDEAIPETTEYYKNLIKGAEIRVFEGCSHNHHLENPEDFNAVIRDFLSRVEKI